MPAPLTDKPIFVADIEPNKRGAALQARRGGGLRSGRCRCAQGHHEGLGGGVGAAVDFAGSDKSLDFAQGAVAKGGAVIIVGLIGGSFSIPVPMFPLRALTIMGSYVGSPAEAHEMMALVKAGKVAPIPVELRPLEQTSRSLDDLRAGRVRRPRRRYPVKAPMRSR